MRVNHFRAILLCAYFHHFARFVTCMTSGEDLASISEWQHDLDQAENSGVHPSTFSSDDVLRSAGTDLDQDLQSLQELSALVAQFRQHERNYVKLYYKNSVSYKLINQATRLNEADLATAMKEHFKPAHRNIAILADDTIVTAHIYRKGVSNQMGKWGLDEGESHLFFWRLNPDRTEVTFKGIATVTPPAVIRHVINQLPKLTLSPDKRWDYLGFTFLVPNRLKFRVPLVAKPV